MTDPIRIVITGGSGRMGQMLIKQVQETDSTVLHAVTRRLIMQRSPLKQSSFMS